MRTTFLMLLFGFNLMAVGVVESDKAYWNRKLTERQEEGYSFINMLIVEEVYGILFYKSSDHDRLQIYTEGEGSNVVKPIEFSWPSSVRFMDFAIERDGEEYSLLFVFRYLGENEVLHNQNFLMKFNYFSGDVFGMWPGEKPADLEGIRSEIKREILAQFFTAE